MVNQLKKVTDDHHVAGCWDQEDFYGPVKAYKVQVVEYSIDLHTNNHAFLQGHRIMCQVQSTWFPVYDRNPQRFVPNIFLARDSDYIVTTQRIFCSSRYPSHVSIPLMRSTMRQTE